MRAVLNDYILATAQAKLNTSPLFMTEHVFHKKRHAVEQASSEIGLVHTVYAIVIDFND